MINPELIGTSHNSWLRGGRRLQPRFRAGAVFGLALLSESDVWKCTSDTTKAVKLDSPMNFGQKRFFFLRKNKHNIFLSYTYLWVISRNVGFLYFDEREHQTEWTVTVRRAVSWVTGRVIIWSVSPELGVNMRWNSLYLILEEESVEGLKEKLKFSHLFFKKCGKTFTYVGTSSNSTSNKRALKRKLEKGGKHSILIWPFHFDRVCWKPFQWWVWNNTSPTVVSRFG